MCPAIGNSFPSATPQFFDLEHNWRAGAGNEIESNFVAIFGKRSRIRSILELKVANSDVLLLASF